MNAREDLLRPAHVETPLCQRALPFRRVTRDAHRLTVATFNWGVKCPGDTQSIMCPECGINDVIGIHRWKVVARDRIKPSTSRISVARRARFGAGKPKSGNGSQGERPQRLARIATEHLPNRAAGDNDDPSAIPSAYYSRRQSTWQHTPVAGQGWAPVDSKNDPSGSKKCSHSTVGMSPTRHRRFSD
jgi:hypothetical protein